MKAENHKTTTVQHLGSKPTAWQMSNLATELSRRADGTVDIDLFKAYLDTAFDALTYLQNKIQSDLNL